MKMIQDAMENLNQNGSYVGESYDFMDGEQIRVSQCDYVTLTP